MNNPHTTKWKEVTLETISTIEMGQSPSSSTYNNQGVGLPFFQGKAEFGKIHPTATKWCSSPNKIANIGDILLSIRAPVGPINIADQKCAIGRGLAAIQAKPGIEIGYIAYFLRNSEKILASMATGSTFPAVTGKVVRDLPILLPPANEQRRIADKLDRVLARVDAANEHLSRVAPLIKRFRQSVLSAATSGRLTEDWRGKKTNWNTATIGQVLADIRYGTAKKCSHDHKGTAVLRIPNIGNHGRIELSNLKYAEFTQKEHESFALQPGDLLLIRSNGSVDLVGKTSVVDKASAGLLFAGYLMRLRIQEDIALPSYIQFALSSPEQRQRVESIARSTSGVNNINTEEVRSLPFLLPPIDEQSEIVRRVEKLFTFADRLEEHLSQAQAAVQKLTPALLAKAFRGELVPQDPNDEPASELLKRLQESRTESTKPSRARKPRARKSS